MGMQLHGSCRGDQPCLLLRGSAWYCLVLLHSATWTTTEYFMTPHTHGDAAAGKLQSTCTVAVCYCMAMHGAASRLTGSDWGGHLAEQEAQGRCWGCTCRSLGAGGSAVEDVSGAPGSAAAASCGCCHGRPDYPLWLYVAACSTGRVRNVLPKCDDARRLHLRTSDQLRGDSWRCSAQ
jgi:hypothetical protein